jgi:hypothetical protein
MILIDPPLLGASSEEWLAYIQLLKGLPACPEKQRALEELPDRLKLSEQVRQLGKQAKSHSKK